MTSPARAITIGTAGWAIPKAVADGFPSTGTALQRYAARFDGVEINSTFYRRHRASTFARWTRDTPPHFRFAVKLPKTITHEARLVGAAPLVAAFRAEIEPLGSKLGPLLVQLPPSLAFDPATARSFFADLRSLWPEAIVCEPRHATWFDEAAEALLSAHEIGRVGADPARHPSAAAPGGWKGVAYWRLHGSPRMYYSAYDDGALRGLSSAIVKASRTSETWCVFDNTTSGAAADNALRLLELCAEKSATQDVGVAPGIGR